MGMKKIALATLVSLGMLSMNAFADSDAYNGFSAGLYPINAEWYE
jgi:hypothetical protein